MASNSNNKTISKEDREKYEVSNWDVLKQAGKSAIRALTPGYEDAKKVKQKSPKAIKNY